MELPISSVPHLDLHPHLCPEGGRDNPSIRNWKDNANDPTKQAGAHVREDATAEEAAADKEYDDLCAAAAAAATAAAATTQAATSAADAEAAAETLLLTAAVGDPALMAGRDAQAVHEAVREEHAQGGECKLT